MHKLLELILTINFTTVGNFSAQEGEAFANNHNLLFMEASAKTGENVEEAFITTSTKVLDMIKRGVYNLNDEVRKL